jgi:NADH:ubiquinone oxidoreductase subunit F (NADH-binding)
MTTALPRTWVIGQPRLLAGVDAYSTTVDLVRHRALHGSLRRPDRDSLAAQLADVRLLGRGGAAFPVASKLAALPRRGSSAVVVNGSEGEPASFKDRVLMTRVPHLILDGAAAVAAALNAAAVEIVVDDPAAAAVLTAATIERGDAVPMRVHRGRGSFVAGEATAVVSRLNAGSGAPDGRRTLPTVAGAYGMPTFLSNVETYAQIGYLVAHGTADFRRCGTGDEPGTSLFTISGAVEDPSVVEVPTGVPLELLLDAVHAPPGVSVLLGGYHGSWWAGDRAVPLSRPALRAAGATLGAGSISVLSPATCALGEVARVARWLGGESMGQCGPCFFGLPALAEDLARLIRGDTSRWYQLHANLDTLPGRGACAHPDGVARFVTNAIHHFRPEVERHAWDGSCGRPVRGELPLPGVPSRSVSMARAAA